MEWTDIYITLFSLTDHTNKPHNFFTQQFIDLTSTPVANLESLVNQTCTSTQSVKRKVKIMPS